PIYRPGTVWAPLRAYPRRGPPTPGRQRQNRLVARHLQRYRHPSTLAERIPQPQNRMDRRKPRQSPQKPVRQRPRKPAILTAMLTCPETQLNWPENQRSNGRKPLDKTHEFPAETPRAVTAASISARASRCPRSTASRTSADHAVVSSGSGLARPRRRN